MNAGLAADVRATYTAGFAHALATQPTNPAWLLAARQQALREFLERGWPSSKQEEWRFTDVSPLLKAPWLPAAPATAVSTYDEDLVELGHGMGHHMVFVDGRHVAGQQAWTPSPPALVVQPLSAAIRNDAQLVRSAMHQHLPSGNAFTALNTAFMTDGAFVHVPAGLQVDAPIFLVFLAATEGGPSYPRTVVVAGANSRATLVEVHLGADRRATLSDALTCIELGPGARLAFHSICRPSSLGSHVGHLAVTQKAGSDFRAHSLALDGRLVRNDAHAVLAEEGCSCQLDGVYLASGTSHIDNQTSIDHRAPGCTSRESYRGVVAGQAQAVWSGRAVVRPGARGTDARQTNRNLVLSDGATVHAKPHLEIFASDVKCSHGATSGRLDAEALFYLRARGIGEREARQILIDAFLRDGLGAVAAPALRAELEALLAGRTRALAQEGAAA
jgi:Fe-S cluster assembly protein SufD